VDTGSGLLAPFQFAVFLTSLALVIHSLMTHRGTGLADLLGRG
jgi:3-vinyl bacteriochlorophyllide hydratase